MKFLKRLTKKWQSIAESSHPAGTLSVELLEQRLLLSAEYSLVNLGTLGGDFSLALGINELGQVVGNSTNSSGVNRSFLWEDGTIIMSPAESPWMDDFVNANDINNNGVIALSMDYNGSEKAGFQDGTKTSVIHTVASEYFSSALSINDDKKIVGYYGNATANYAFLWQTGAGMVSIDGTNPSLANDINNSVQIVGKSKVNSYSYHAALWEGQTKTDLDVGNAYSSEAYGINESGQVVGWRQLDYTGRYHGFLWDSTTGMKDLGTLGGARNSNAWAINNTGQIVGISDISEPGQYRAFVYANDEMRNLNDLLPGGSGWTLLAASDINDAGQIVGWGSFNGQTLAYLLNPLGDSQPPIAMVTADNINVAGAATHTFSVTYSDNVAIDVSSLDGSDIRVISPNGFNQAAAFISVNSNSDGSPRVVSYRINAPGGNWSMPDSGDYTIIIAANQVSDTSNNYVAAGVLGTFSVNLTPKPVADLADPGANSAVTQSLLNNKGFIDVTFFDLSGAGLNSATILDATPEFTLSEPAADTDLLVFFRDLWQPG